jgi:hypothetical protein
LRGITSLPVFEILQSTSDFIETEFDIYPVAASGIVYDYGGNQITSITDDDISIGSQVTISGNCGGSQNNPNRILVLTASGLALNDTFQIYSGEGMYETFKVLAIGTGYVETDKPLIYDYNAGDVIRQNTVTYTLCPDETESLAQNYRVRLIAIDANGTRKYKDVLYDVVSHKPEQPITIANLRDYDPVIWRLEPQETEGTDYKTLLEVAWRSVKNDLKAQATRPAWYMNEEQLAELQLCKFKELLAEIGISALSGVSSIEAAKYWRDKYNLLISSRTNSQDWLDENQDSVPDTSIEVNKRRRGVIL